MQVAVLPIPLDEIKDWATFHDVFQQTLSFPDFYGRNMDAWIDCMTSLDAPKDGMTAVTVERGGLLVMEMQDLSGFERRCPEQYRALLQAIAFVNFRRHEAGEAPVLAVLPIGGM